MNLQKYIVKPNQQRSSHSGLPYLNSLFINNFSAFSPSGKDVSFKTYMKWVRRSPQLVGFLNMIIADIMSDNISWIPAQRSRYVKKNIRNSERFFTLNKGREILEESLMDFLTVGISYNWLGKISEAQFKEMCSEISERLKKEYRFEFKAEDIMNNVLSSGDLSLAKKWRHIPASTVVINANEVEPIEYIQRIGAKYRYYSPSEIITYKMIPFDGKLYPLAPLESLFSEVYLLWLISQNYVSLFENGGSPDKVFILPSEIAGSKNHSYLINTLKKYKKIQNKHGNLVFTGDLKIEDLLKVEDQMQNKDLSLYLVGVLALYYGIPSGRIPFLLGKAANSAEGGGLSDSAYWRKIGVWQTKIEVALNRDLWIPYFNTEMKFKRGYKQDEIREVAVDKQKNDVAEQRLKLGLWTTEEAGKYLGIDIDEIKRAQKEKEEFESKMVQQGMLSNQDKMSDGDKRQNELRTMNTQNNNVALSGGSPNA